MKLNEKDLLKPSQVAHSHSWIKCSSCHGLVDFFLSRTLGHVMMDSVYCLEDIKMFLFLWFLMKLKWSCVREATNT